MEPIAIGFKIVVLLGFVLLMIHLFLYWVNNLIKLMQMSSDEFPEKYDRIFWMFFIVIFSFGGAFTFSKWHKTFEQKKQKNKTKI